MFIKINNYKWMREKNEWEIIKYRNELIIQTKVTNIYLNIWTFQIKLNSCNSSYSRYFGQILWYRTRAADRDVASKPEKYYLQQNGTPNTTITTKQ